MEEQLVLVDEQDNPIGHAAKIRVHRSGLLHRAFSILIFDDLGRLLLQQRALGKYHSEGLWTNSCCGHPRHGERTDTAAARRLNEEMGLRCETLIEVHAFVYQEQVSNRLIEHEYDHVYVGLTRADPISNPKEALDWKWQSLADIEQDVRNTPELFTVWFRNIFNQGGIERVGMWRDRLFSSQEVNTSRSAL